MTRKELDSVPEVSLVSSTALGDYSESIGATTLSAINDMGIGSLAIRMKCRSRLAETISKSWQLEIPGPGRFAGPNAAGFTLVWIMQDQLFLLHDASCKEIVSIADPVVRDSAYLVDQTDNWCVFRLQGNLANPGLERICPIDLHMKSFPPGSATRTVFEHMGVILLRFGPSDYMLLSASSSARSFFHSLRQSLVNVA